MLESLKRLCEEYERLHGIEYTIHLHSDILDMLNGNPDFHYWMDDGDEYVFQYKGHNIYLMNEFGILIEEGKSYFWNIDMSAEEYSDAWKELQVTL